MARRFRFRLETVRRLRERERDEQQRAVARTVQAMTRLDEQIGNLSRQLQHTIADARELHAPARLDVNSLRGHQLYRGWLHRRILESDTELLRRKAEYEVEREKLVEASKRLKVIENLRERQLARYGKDVAREEQALTDEVACQQHLRRRPIG